MITPLYALVISTVAFHVVEIVEGYTAGLIGERLGIENERIANWGYLEAEPRDVLWCGLEHILI